MDQKAETEPDRAIEELNATDSLVDDLIAQSVPETDEELDIWETDEPEDEDTVSFDEPEEEGEEFEDDSDSDDKTDEEEDSDTTDDTKEPEKETDKEPEPPTWINEKLKDFLEEGETPEQGLDKVLTKTKELETLLEEENKANEKLSKVFAENPEAVQLIRLMDQGYTAEEAVALTLDVDSLREMMEDTTLKEKLIEARVKRELSKKEQETTNKQLQERQKQSQTRLESFVEKKAIEKDTFVKSIESVIKPILEGNLTEDILDIMYKGINFEKAVQEAEKKGTIQGKNEKIRKELNRKKGDGLPQGKSGRKTVSPKKKGTLGGVTINTISADDYSYDGDGW